MPIKAINALLLVALGLCVPTIGRSNELCVNEGMKAYKNGGARAALPLFEAKLKDPRCQNSPKLKFNYARSLKELIRQEGNGIRSCLATEIFQVLQTNRELPEFMRRLAAQDGAKLLRLCGELASDITEDRYQTYVRYADELARDGHTGRAILEWRAILRMDDTRIEPQRALCRLLPSVGLHDEAKLRCVGWRTQVMETTQPASSGSRTSAWVFTGLSATSLVGAIIVYGMASSAHEDLLKARERAQTAASMFMRDEYDLAAAEYSSLQTKMQSLQYTSWGLLGGGVLFGGLATYFWLSPTDTKVSLSPTGLQFTARW